MNMKFSASSQLKWTFSSQLDLALFYEFQHCFLMCYSCNPSLGYMTCEVSNGPDDDVTCKPRDVSGEQYLCEI